MVRVLGAVSVDHLVAAVVSLQREVDLQHVGARLDDLQDPVRLRHLLLPRGAHVLHVHVDQLVLGQDAGLVEEVLHHLEEARVLGLGDVLKSVGHGEAAERGGGGVELGGRGRS